MRAALPASLDAEEHGGERVNAGTTLVSSFVKAANTLGIFGLIGALIFVGLELRQQRSALADVAPPSEAAVPTLAEREVMLVCEFVAAVGGDRSDHKFLIDTVAATATFVSLQDAVVGDLKTEGTSYVLHFPRTDERYEAVVIVNRYTGEATWEFGEPPFGEYTSDNAFYEGTCTRGDNAVMF